MSSRGGILPSRLAKSRIRPPAHRIRPPAHRMHRTSGPVLKPFLIEPSPATESTATTCRCGLFSACLLLLTDFVDSQRAPNMARDVFCCRGCFPQAQ